MPGPRTPCKQALWRFPARNRIIAGLCAATVVVEARERSGALITADFALEDGREVMVVPGEITSSVSAGSNALLRLGATPVTHAADVLEAYGIVSEPEPVEAPVGLPGRLLARLTEHPSSIDELARTLGLEPGEVAAALIELELAGLVQRGGRRLPFGGEDVGKAAGSTIRACHVPPASCSRSPPRSCRLRERTPPGRRRGRSLSSSCRRSSPRRTRPAGRSDCSSPVPAPPSPVSARLHPSCAGVSSLPWSASMAPSC